MESNTRMKRRRTVIAAMALAVPALLVSTAAPAIAAVDNPTIALTAPATAIVGEKPLLTALVSKSGAPVAGQSVTFTVDAISVAVFGTASKSVTLPTDASGQAIVPNLWIRNAGTVTITVTSGGSTTTKSIYIEPSTGTLTFPQSKLVVAPNSENTLTGKVTRLTGTVNPSFVGLTYSGDVTGPVSAPVNIGMGFVVKGIKVGPAGGTVTATATNFGQTQMTFATR